MAQKGATRQAKKRHSGLIVGEEVRTSYFYMLNTLLHSRVHTGLESNSEIYDEDVTVYLANLLNGFVDPDYTRKIQDLVRASDLEIKTFADAPETTTRQKYEIYKANAEDLLMRAAVFREEPEDRISLGRFDHSPRERMLGRASAYYGVAAYYQKQLAKDRNGVSIVMEKLSQYTGMYARILEYASSNYFGFVPRLTTGEMFHLDREIADVRVEIEKEEARDAYLDAYITVFLSKGPISDEDIARLAHQGQEYGRYGVDGVLTTSEDVLKKLRSEEEAKSHANL
jgi:hypothetical protein